MPEEIHKPILIVIAGPNGSGKTKRLFQQTFDVTVDITALKKDLQSNKIIDIKTNSAPKDKKQK